MILVERFCSEFRRICRSSSCHRFFGVNNFGLLVLCWTKKIILVGYIIVQAHTSPSKNPHFDWCSILGLKKNCALDLRSA
jgi:hypothetical protein